MNWLKKIFSKNKVSKKDQKRLDEWERGQYLKIGEDIDNKAAILEAEQ